MSPEIFLNEKQKEIDNPLINWGVGFTATVMMEFAIEYHKQELSKLHQPTVIKNELAVCDCDEEHLCGICYKSKGYDIVDGQLKQTVL